MIFNGKFSNRQSTNRNIANPTLASGPVAFRENILRVRDDSGGPNTASRPEGLGEGELLEARLLRRKRELF